MPDESQIAWRMLCRLAVNMRSAAEEAFLEDRHGWAVPFMANWTRWVESDLGRHFSRSERKVVRAQPGAMSRDDSIEASWAAESGMTLAWALGLCEWADFDAMFDFESVAWVKPGTTAADVLERASLRDPETIAHMRDLTELWHWRERNEYFLRGQYKTSEPHDWLGIAREAAAMAHANGDLKDTLDGDFAVFGKPYHAVTNEELAQLGSHATERHKALNWLCGQADDWDKVSTDT